MKLITIIPAYNEENNIKRVIEGALKHSDVLVVDDGSNDNTFNLAKRAGVNVIKHEKNKGKGAAIKTGLKAALEDGYDILILLDGDGQHNPIHIPLLVSCINDAGLVIASRFKEGTPSNMPIQRRLSNVITTRIIRFITGYKITDSQSGFRAISSNVARLFLDIGYDDYIYESEMLYRASKNNIKIKEVSIPSTYGVEKSYVKAKHALKYIIFILRLLIRRIKP